MMLRSAKPKPDFATTNVRFAADVDYDILGGSSGPEQPRPRVRFGGVAWGEPSRESLGLDTGERKQRRVAEGTEYNIFGEG